MPKKGRTKLAADEVATREQAEQVLGEIARLSVMQEALETALADEIVTATEKYEGRIESARLEIRSRTKLLNTWAKANPAEFPKGKKSIEFIFGRLGFRTTTLSVSRLRKATVESIVGRLQKEFAKYVRTKPEINKDAIISDYIAAEKSPDPKAKQWLVDSLDALDLRVGRSETFFVEPRLTADGKKEEASNV